MSTTEQRIAELLHSLRLLSNAIGDDRPAISEADEHMDQCLIALDEAIGCLQAVRTVVLEHDMTLDAIDAGDLVETRHGIVEAREERYP